MSVLSKEGSAVAAASHSDEFRALRVAAPVAFLGWYVFALFSPFSTAGSNTGIMLVLIATAAVFPRFWCDARREPVFWLVLVLTGYVLVRSLLALNSLPQLDESKNPHWTHVLRVTGVIALPMGWWLYRYPRQLVPVLVVALAGLLLGALYGGSWPQILEGRFDQRELWGYPPGYLGMVSTSMILALLAWLLLPLKGAVLRKAWLYGVPMLGIALLFLYTSQTRAAWLALPLGVLVILAFILAGSHGRASVKLVLGLAGLLLLAVLAVWAIDGGEMLQRRLMREWETISLLLQGDVASAIAARGSVGSRIEMWFAGVRAFAEKPWFGWGPGAGLVLLRGEFASMRYGHFHNLYVELIVGLGLVGFVLAGMTAAMLLLSGLRATRLSIWTPALAAGTFSITAAVAILLCFEIRIGQTEGRAALTLLTALYAMAAFCVRPSIGGAGNTRP